MDGRLAVSRVVVAGGAEGGEAAIVGLDAASRQGFQRSAIGLVVDRMHEIEAGDIIDEMALGRGDAQLFRGLVEQQIPMVGHGRNTRGENRQLVVILDLDVLPFAEGGDRGQCVVAQRPIHRGRDAAIIVARAAVGVVGHGRVVGRSDHARFGEIGGQGRAVGDRTGRIGGLGGRGEHAVRHRVAREQIIGGQGDAQIGIGREQQLAAHAVMDIAVEGVAVGDVLDVAALAVRQTRKQDRQQAGYHFARHAGLDAIFVAAAQIGRVDIGVRRRGRFGGLDIDDAGGGVLAEQGALRSAQHFDPVDVEKIQRRLARPRQHHPIHHRGNRRLDARRRGDRTDAAHEDVAILVG